MMAEPRISPIQAARFRGDVPFQNTSFTSLSHGCCSMFLSKVFKFRILEYLWGMWSWAHESWSLFSLQALHILAPARYGQDLSAHWHGTGIFHGQNPGPWSISCISVSFRRCIRVRTGIVAYPASQLVHACPKSFRIEIRTDLHWIQHYWGKHHEHIFVWNVLASGFLPPTTPRSVVAKPLPSLAFLSTLQLRSVSWKCCRLRHVGMNRGHEVVNILKMELGKL